MWQLTPFGFFSIVQKPNTDFLTVRSRVAGDLDALRTRYLSELSPTLTGAGTDYPYRATCSHAAFAAAQVKIIQDIDYSNFKSRVGVTQGHARSHLYAEVWSVLKQLEAQKAPAPVIPSGKKLSYGGILVDDQGRILLRRPTGDYDGAKWTFPKGRPDPGETPEDAALREVLEETGYTGQILTPIPGSFEGTTTSNRYWLVQAGQKLQEAGWETQDLAWCSPAQARARIQQSPSRTKRTRDLAVLEAALKLLKPL